MCNFSHYKYHLFLSAVSTYSLIASVPFHYCHNSPNTHVFSLPSNCMRTIDRCFCPPQPSTSPSSSIIDTVAFIIFCLRMGGGSHPQWSVQFAKICSRAKRKLGIGNFRLWELRPRRERATFWSGPRGPTVDRAADCLANKALTVSHSFTGRRV